MAKTTLAAIDWKKVWDNYDKWLNRSEDGKQCSLCHRIPSAVFPNWEKQQLKIQKLVNAQTRVTVGTIINWGKLWDSFERWLATDRRTCCPRCDYIEKNYPEWEDQQRKIQRLVNAQLRRN